jgi:hypothetical protein
MPKRPRENKRLSVIASDVAETTEAAARAAALSQRVDSSLFTIDAPTTKRSRGTPAANTTSSSILSETSSSDLITSALSAVSRVKFMQPPRQPPALVISASARKAHESSAHRTARTTTVTSTVSSRSGEAGAGGIVSTSFIDPWAIGSGVGTSEGVIIDSSISLRPRVPSSAPAVSVGAPLSRILSTPAAPGSSYHPTVYDHQRALAAALDVETHASKSSRRRLAALGEEGGIRETVEEAAETKARRAAIVSAADRIDDAEDDEDEGMTTTTGVTIADDEGQSTLAEPRVRKVKLDRTARIAAIKAKRKAAAILLATAVDRDIEDVVAAEAALAANGPKRKNSKSVVAAEVARVAAAAAPLLDVPLSEELTGSLRTIRPLTGGQLLLAAMPALSRRGDVGRRARIPHVLTRERADGSGPELVLFSAGAVRASTGRKNPWKIYEFPRRKNFEPAEDAVRDAQARGTVRGQVPGVTLDFAASQAAREKVKKEGAK